MVFKLRNGGEFMKKRVIFIVGGILIFIGIVLLGFFLYEEKLKEDTSSKTYYNYFVQEPNVLYYPSEDGYIYAVADFIKQIENYENLEYLVLGLFRKRATDMEDHYELIYQLKGWNYEETYNRMKFFKNKLYMVNDFSDCIYVLDFSKDEVTAEDFSGDINKFTGYRIAEIEHISQDGLLITMQDYHDQDIEKIEIFCNFNKECYQIN